MTWFKRAGSVILLLAITVVDLSLAAWPELAYSIFFSFICIIIVSSVYSLPASLRWAIAQGLLLDLFSPSPFGIYLISSIALVYCVQILQYSWLKQKTVVHQLLISSISILLATGIFFALHKFLYFLRIIEFRVIDLDTTSLMKFSSSIVGSGSSVCVALIAIRYLQRHDRFL